ncbi:39S ribosomal protein L10, mitochondrial-like [Xenia sp. Carnegie-2017]|uniref:39S ribosomal protein L10, mitochondrial-like n=1 Tax=Xenia sp. Carnegie-2017 TaxID=2897299 RepID=UPI001F04D3EB|nr:39S ribosomal protein L10, mitochondrial-like [Xenia sp. Carnegie-2017]
MATKVLGLHKNCIANKRLTINLANTCKARRQIHSREIKPQPHKIQLASEIRNLFHENEMVAVLGYYDMKSIEWNEVIFEAGKNDIKLRFLPNKIVHRALDSTGYVNMSPLFIGSTAVAYSKDIQLKGLLQTVKNQRKVQLLGAKINDRLFGIEKLTWVAKLPLLEQLHCEISMSLSQPLQTLKQTLSRNQQLLSQNLQLLTSAENS